MAHDSRNVYGIAVSPGIAIGKAHVLERGKIQVPQYTLPNGVAVERECERFERAVVRAEKDLREIKDGIHPEFREHAQIIEVHLMMLRDRLLYDETLACIREEKLNAQWALSRSLKKAHDLFDALTDEYIRSRVADVDAVGERVLRNLAGQTHDLFSEIRERVIIVARDLSPADTAQLQLERTLGLVTDMGGRTSHTSILARSLNIPAVVGTEKATEVVPAGKVIIVDGIAGCVITNPTEREIAAYYERQEELERYRVEISKKSHLPAETRDGVRVGVEANIELIEEVVAAKDNGAEGVGLYRTEFFFMNRKELPDEETLYYTYRELAELMAPQRVTMRTLDLGAEKVAAWFPRLQEANPALGLRSIRLCLYYRDLFKTQLRAILRASAAARNLRLMFPLVSGVGELLDAKRVLKEVQEELTIQRIPFDEDMPIGVMIEVPSAAVVADLMARKVQFFSVGTNDLIQYSIAIDRANEHVAYLYEPLHPGVLRLLKQTVDAGHRAGIEVSICGEMAADPFNLPILLGLQFDTLSMNPQAVPQVKHLVSYSHVKTCQRFVKEALQLSTSREISDLLQRKFFDKLPQDLRLFSTSGWITQSRTSALSRQAS